LLLNQQNQNPKRGGSTIGQKEIWFNWLQGHQQLYNNYFSETPNYPEEYFWQCFWMQRLLFLKIFQSLTKHNPYFVQKQDAAKRLGFLPLQKATAAM
jgi:hypothetical protein